MSKIFLGIMSGTSLDGLDICAVSFSDNSFKIKCAETISYSDDMFALLSNAHNLSGADLMQLHVDYGVYCGKKINDFISKNLLTVDYISSHGHTVFHTPSTGVTFQIGSGAHIAATTGISVINDFRTLDVAHGGQGAPLVPIGDELLFPEYDFCLNIGGFANISSSISGKREAWDICAANIVLNEYARKLGKNFDKGGELGKQGSVNINLLNSLNSLEFFSLNPPKSLGREWVDTIVMPLFQSFNCSDLDKMRTFYEHIAVQIASVLQSPNSKVLCTGGGVHNSFIIERIEALSKSKIIIPDKMVIDFKEALIFAYLGYLRIQNKPNCLSSVTGASKDVCGGIIWTV